MRVLVPQSEEVPAVAFTRNLINCVLYPHPGAMLCVEPFPLYLSPISVVYERPVAFLCKEPRILEIFKCSVFDYPNCRCTRRGSRFLAQTVCTSLDVETELITNKQTGHPKISQTLFARVLAVLFMTTNSRLIHVDPNS